jgi:hypothetical protein
MAWIDSRVIAKCEEHGLKCLFQIVKVIDRRRRVGMQAEQLGLLRDVIVEEPVVTMEADRSVHHRFLCACNSRNMVDVCVRKKNIFHRKMLLPHDVEQHADLVSRIDENGLAGALAPDHESVFVKRRDAATL